LVRGQLHNQSDFSLEQVIEFFNSGANGNQYLAITFSHSDTLVGYIRLLVSKEGGGALFVGMDIDPNYQGIGLGRLLWGSLLQQLIQFPEYRIQLRVLKSNDVAYKLYLGLGFYIVEESGTDILMEVSRATFRPKEVSPSCIVSVMGPKDEGFIIANFEQIQKSNPDEILHFTLVNQDPSWNNFASNVVLLNENRILVLQGKFEITDSEKSLFTRARASLFHARALQLALQRVSDFKGLVIFIDPDFYILRKEWVREIVEMVSSGVTFIGAGYHPKHITSYKNFPTPFFLCFNTNSVAVDEVDFFPDPLQIEEHPEADQRTTFTTKFLKKISRLLLPLTSEITWRFKESRDTGFALQQKFAKSKYYCFKVAVKPEDVFIPLFLRWKIGRFLESFFFGKTRYSLMPLKKNYTEVFKSAVSNFDWDEYMFQEEIFAFHVRKSNTVSSYKTHLYDSVLDEVKINFSRLL